MASKENKAANKEVNKQLHPPFQRGEELLIVRGKYKHHKNGSFLRHKATVFDGVDIDTAGDGRLCLNGIERLQEESSKKNWFTLDLLWMTTAI